MFYHLLIVNSPEALYALKIVLSRFLRNHISPYCYGCPYCMWTLFLLCFPSGWHLMTSVSTSQTCQSAAWWTRPCSLCRRHGRGVSVRVCGRGQIGTAAVLIIKTLCWKTHRLVDGVSGCIFSYVGGPRFCRFLNCKVGFCVSGRSQCESLWAWPDRNGGCLNNKVIMNYGCVWVNGILWELINEISNPRFLPAAML